MNLQKLYTKSFFFVSNNFTAARKFNVGTWERNLNRQKSNSFENILLCLKVGGIWLISSCRFFFLSREFSIFKYFVASMCLSSHYRKKETFLERFMHVLYVKSIDWNFTEISRGLENYCVRPRLWFYGLKNLHKRFFLGMNTWVFQEKLNDDFSEKFKWKP